MPLTPVLSTNSRTVGSVEPRLFTPPLRELTPETSFGFDLIDFARDVLGIELDPWQQWLAIHIGELLPDGRPRFRQILVLVARQNGKTTLAQVLTLYWMAVEEVPLVLGTSTNRMYAKRAWQETCKTAKRCQWLAATTRETIGEEALNIGDSQYLFAASSGQAGRSLTVHRLVLDEIREHKDFETWGAATNAMRAVPAAQVICISNQGDNDSVVLDFLRNSAMDHIENGTGDPRTGLFEWSAPNGSDPTDPEALAAANPNMGDRITLEDLLADARTAKAAGGEALATFRTEALCMRVHLIDSAIDFDAWVAGARDVIDLAEHRARVALALDIALDGSHATLVAAATLPHGTHSEVVHAWEGYGCTAQVRRELPDLVTKIKPGAIGWFPNGPAAALAANLRANWAPRGTRIEEITGDMTAVCMGLAEQVIAGEVTHTGDPLLQAQVENAQKLRRGDAWVYTRRGSGSVDAVYALAGAVHLARTMPPPRPPLVVLP